MGMNRYTVTIAAPKIGPVAHIIKADSMGEAQARAQAAHPGAVIISSSKIKEGDE